MKNQSLITPPKVRIVVGLLFVCVVPIEVLCALLAYETLGEIDSAFYFMTIALNIPFFILAWKKPFAGAIACVALAGLIIPYQAYLGKRMIDVQAEATHMVAYVYSVKAETGEFPSNLIGYSYANSNTSRFFQRYNRFRGKARFAITYRIGKEGTSHWYDSKTGWGYYPD